MKLVFWFCFITVFSICVLAQEENPNDFIPYSIPYAGETLKIDNEPTVYDNINDYIDQDKTYESLIVNNSGDCISGWANAIAGAASINHKIIFIEDKSNFIASPQMLLDCVRGQNTRACCEWGDFSQALHAFSSLYSLSDYPIDSVSECDTEFDTYKECKIPALTDKVTIEVTKQALFSFDPSDILEKCPKVLKKFGPFVTSFYYSSSLNKCPDEPRSADTIGIVLGYKVDGTEFEGNLPYFEVFVTGHKGNDVSKLNTIVKVPLCSDGFNGMCTSDENGYANSAVVYTGNDFQTVFEDVIPKLKINEDSVAPEPKIGTMECTDQGFSFSDRDIIVGSPLICSEKNSLVTYDPSGDGRIGIASYNGTSFVLNDQTANGKAFLSFGTSAVFFNGKFILGAPSSGNGELIIMDLTTGLTQVKRPPIAENQFISGYGCGLAVGRTSSDQYLVIGAPRSSFFDTREQTMHGALVTCDKDFKCQIISPEFIGNHKNGYFGYRVEASNQYFAGIAMGSINSCPYITVYEYTENGISYLAEFNAGTQFKKTNFVFRLSNDNFFIKNDQNTDALSLQFYKRNGKLYTIDVRLVPGSAISSCNYINVLRNFAHDFYVVGNTLAVTAPNSTINFPIQGGVIDVDLGVIILYFHFYDGWGLFKVLTPMVYIENLQYGEHISVNNDYITAYLGGSVYTYYHPSCGEKCTECVIENKECRFCEIPYIVNDDGVCSSATAGTLSILLLLFLFLI